MVCGEKEEDGVSGEEKPALIVLPPLSIISVLAGGTGPDDFVFRAGAILSHIGHATKVCELSQ